MARPQHNTTKLPKQLLQELGQKDLGNGNGFRNGVARGNNRRNGLVGRKERRKMERAERKHASSTRRSTERLTTGSRLKKKQEADVSETDEEPVVPKEALKLPSAVSPNSTPLRSILKKSSSFPSPLPSADEPPLSNRPITRAVRDKLAEDDDEIAALEKALGMKGKKGLPKSFIDDGLDDLLEGLETDSADERSGKRKRNKEGEEWIMQKRRKGAAAEEERNERSEESTDDISVDEDESEPASDDEDDLEVDDDASEETSFDGFDSEQENSIPQATVPRRRENPYIAPVQATNSSATQKYVPPSLRTSSTSNKESGSLLRLRRQLVGLMNKLSEANMTSIVTEMEEIYGSNARGHVTSILCSHLLDLIGSPTTLSDSFILLHAGLISALYKILGADFGAEILSRAVSVFDSAYMKSEPTSKEVHNIVSLLSALFVFNIITSTIIFDFVRQFLNRLTETHTELLLRILTTCGPQLRSSDPGSMKSIVLLLQPAIEAAGGELNLSVRTKFMIETIIAVKNNRGVKPGGAGNSALIAEHTTKMRKILGSFNDGRRNIRGNEPLNITLADLRDTAKRGKWWLVGASWHPSPQDQAILAVDTAQNNSQESLSRSAPFDIMDISSSTSIYALAQSSAMRTPTRQVIFTTLLTAPDYISASTSLLSLKLKKSVFRAEAPRVLLQCVASEQVYNPYYALVARKLCESDRRLTTGLKFAVWHFYRACGHDPQDGDEDNFSGDDEEQLRISDVSTRKIVNAAKLVSALLTSHTLSLDNVLKPLHDLRLLKRGSKISTFVEVLLVAMMLDSQKTAKRSGRELGRDASKVIASTFSSCAGDAAAGVIWFIEKIVRKSDLVFGSGKDREKLRVGCKIAIEALASSTIGPDADTGSGEEDMITDSDEDDI